MPSVEPVSFNWEVGPDGERRKKPARGTKWRARYRDPNGHSRRKIFDRQVDAQHFLERVGVDLQSGRFSDPKLQQRRFEEWAEDWAAGLAVAPTTLRGYHQARDRLSDYFDGRPIGTITRATVRHFVKELRDQDYAPKTVRATVSVLKMILDLAVEERALPENPASRLRLGSSRKHEPMFFTAEQIATLAAHAEPPFGTFVLFDAYTGLRPSEVCGLRVGRVDLMRGRIHVAEALNDVNGRAIPGPTKTYATRTVPMPPAVCQRLARHLELRREQLGRDLDPSDYVFVAPKGGPLRVAKARIWIRRALVTAGLPDEFRTYDLRHTCASLLIATGAHPRAIMERLGHESITTTLDLYGHLFPELEAELTDRLDAMYRDETTVAQEVSPVVLALNRLGAETTRTPGLEASRLLGR